jgi:hypothetical protein
MKYIQKFHVALLLALASPTAVSASTNILNGLTYYQGNEKLAGTIVFQLQDGYIKNGETVGTNSEHSASIYEFDLQKQQLRKVTTSPKGYAFIGSDQGDVYCVLYGPFDSYGASYSNAFVHSDSLNRNRIVSLDRTPTTTCISGGHVFFEFGMSFEKDHRLLDYDVALDRIQPAEFSDTRWQERNAAMYSAPKASNGRYIFFAGNDAPSEGFTLVSSLGNVFDTKNEPKGKDLRVLHSFTKMSVFPGNEYLLVQLSPDGRYALIRLETQSHFKTKEAADDSSGWVNDYYLVDVSNGKTRKLLMDEVELKSHNSILGLHWVVGTQ